MPAYIHPSFSGKSSTGGTSNTASGISTTVAGGARGTALGDWSAVGGGWGNETRDLLATVGGGGINIARGGYNTIGGGWDNESNGLDTTIGGGYGNTATGERTTIGGGYGNIATGQRSTIGGGYSNWTTGTYSTVPGGRSNAAAGAYSYAAGRRAKANHNGAFVWADSSDYDFPSTTTNQFNVRATGGARFVSAVDGSGNPTAGVLLSAGAGAWSSLSDRHFKENFRALDKQEILERLSAIPIESWNLKSQAPTIRHIGPTAQDFYGAFQIGESTRHINSSDADGVALAAIQALHETAKEKDEKMAAQAREIDELKVRLAALEACMQSMRLE